jgi:O-antigen ligase
MISNGLIALFLSVGVSAWLYNQFMKRTNNKQNSVIAAIFVGIIVFIICLTLFHSLFGSE